MAFSVAERGAVSATPLRRSLREIASVLEVIDHEHFRWLGDTHGVAPGDMLQPELDRVLYECCYVCGRPGLPAWSGIWPPPARERAHVARLEAARPTHLTIREDTPVGRQSAHRVELKLLDITLSAVPASARVAPRTRLADVDMPNTRRSSSPGFWSLFGVRHPLDDDEDQIIRLYWNVCAAGGPLLVEALAGGLDATGVPFRLKLLSRPHDYNGRCDAAVLYIGRRWWPTAAEPIRMAYRALAPLLSAATPLMSRALAPGLGYADDPPGGAMSFGQHRCRLVAAGLLDAARAGITRNDAVAEHVEGHLAMAGIDPARPHLNPGSIDVTHDIMVRRRRTPRSSEPTCLDVARSVCAGLVATAIWHEDRCAWLGPELLGRPRGGLEQGWASTGPDLYAGTAGIGLVLAEAGRLLSDPEAAHTALAALRHGLAHSHGISPRFAGGFYNGVPGIAVAALRGSQLLDDPSLAVDALAALDAVAETPEFDLMWGTAGTILALLVAHAITGRDRLLRRAVTCADRLVARGVDDGRGLSWSSATLATIDHPVGISHGACGAGLVLCELGHASGEARFAEAGRRALAYAANHFDRRQRNWPNLLIAGDPRADRHRSFPATWCHGAPGIALAHIRADALAPDPERRGILRLALTTTDRATQRWFDSGRWNFSLCHGLLGNAEVLRHGSDTHDATRTVERVSRAGSREALVHRRPWCLDVPDGEPPGLMNGLAGVLHHYLRMHAPEIPSLLLVEPSFWRGDARPKGGGLHP